MEFVAVFMGHEFHEFCHRSEHEADRQAEVASLLEYLRQAVTARQGQLLFRIDLRDVVKPAHDLVPVNSRIAREPLRARGADQV